MEFARLPEAVRMEMTELVGLFNEIHAATNKQAACRVIEARYAGVRGRSASRLSALYHKFLKLGWRACVNRSKAGKPWWLQAEQSAVLPEAFLQEWKRRCEANQRKCKPAHRALLAQWQRWWRGDRRAALPGYSECPPPGTTGKHPDGWSYENLMRHAPPAYDLKAARVGRSAARAMLPLVYTTRADLWVGSHYMFDDLWHDHMVNVLDTAKTGRPLEFGAFDLYSACKFAWGMRVRVEGADGRMQGLKEDMMRMLVAKVLGQDGFSPRGTVLVVEHGTAAIREELEKLLHDLSGGRITVTRSGMDGGGDALGIYAGRGRGNFRLKAAYESLHGLVHNEFADLPGQTGRNVELRPEALHGLLKHNDALVAAFAGLALERPDLAALLRMPLLEFSQFLALTMDVYGRINQRVDHRIEGWGANVCCDLRNGVYHVRRLSPQEVWQRGRGALQRLAPEAVALILGPDLGEERHVRGPRFELMCKEVSPDPIIFNTVTVPPGKYRAVFNPFQPDRVFFFNARGGLVAEARRVFRISRLDPEALRRAMGEAAHTEAVALGPLRERGALALQQRLEDARHNAAVARAAGASGARPEPAPREHVETDCTEQLLARAQHTVPEPEEW